jgi:DNA-binding IclR family transcriptional regulator
MARWLLVLDAFGTRREWGIRDLAAQSGLPRSTVSRVVHEMTRLGLLTPAGPVGRTRVGPTLARLAIRLVDSVDVVRAARPALDELREETVETAILTLYDQTRRQFRAVIAPEASHPIRISGNRCRAGATHLGRAASWLSCHPTSITS